MKKLLFIVLLMGSLVCAADDIYPNDWEKVKLKGLNLIRLEVPGGWFVREGLGKMALTAFDGQTRMMIFVPDPEHSWDPDRKERWEILRLKGLNLHRLPVPGGWLVREGWGKIGTENQTNMIVYLADPDHRWVVENR